MRDAKFAGALASAILSAWSPGVLTASPPIEAADIAAGNGGFVIDGFHYDVDAAGDFNGDGFADVIVAWPVDERAFVVFGKADGTPESLDGIGSTTEGWIVTSPTNSELGIVSIIRAGDVNGDGLPDFAVSDHSADVIPGRYDAGLTHVIFGKEDDAPVDLSSIDSGLGGFVIRGAEPYDRSGLAIAGGGDINGDGFDDVVVTSQYADLAGVPQRGLNYVVFGKPTGDPVELSAIKAGSGGFIIATGPETGPFVSHTGNLAAAGGDVNGDGLADVIVNFPNAVTGINACVVFGKADSAMIELNDVVAGAGGFALRSSYSSEFSIGGGFGDVNGDGLSDFVVALPEADLPSRANAGESYVVFGKRSGSTVNLTDIAAGVGGFSIRGADLNDMSGIGSTCVGDINGDGFCDIGVAALSADHGGQQNVGEGYVVFGKPDGGAVNLSDIIAGTGGFVLNGSEAAGAVGMKGAWGGADINGDGLSDVLFRSPGFRVFAVFGPETPPLSATYRGYSRQGDGEGGGAVPRLIFRDARVTIDYFDGDFGIAPDFLPSLETVTITRSNAGIENLNAEGGIANVVWQITSDRHHWTWTTAELTFKYVESEIAGLAASENELTIYTAPALDGPWRPLDSRVNAGRNEIRATVSEFSYFAIAASPLGAKRGEKYE